MTTLPVSKRPELVLVTTPTDNRNPSDPTAHPPQERGRLDVPLPHDSERRDGNCPPSVNLERQLGIGKGIDRNIRRKRPQAGDSHLVGAPAD